MAKPMRIISLNLGSQTIGLAEFQAKAEGGLVLQNYRLREVLIDPVGEGIRHTQISATLREMMAELQIRHEAFNYAVPAQSVFARFVKLPAVEEEKIERIIAFEAQQNVPFPIDEVVWDYQLIGGGGDEQVQVVLVAIKADLLDEINAAVEETGLRRKRAAPRSVLFAMAEARAMHTCANLLARDCTSQSNFVILSALLQWRTRRRSTN